MVRRGPLGVAGLSALLAFATACHDGASSASGSGCTENEALVTWENWGAGFFAGYCRSCHSSATPDRRGAPPGMDFDTPEQVLAFRAAIETSVIDEATMPYGGGLPTEELARLEAFFACSP